MEAIGEMAALADRLGLPLWLRGGWAVDFLVGRVTRDHTDVDWFALVDDGPRIAEEAISLGFADVTIAAPGQQIDLQRGRVEHSLALVRLGAHEEPMVGGGPWEGEPWPTDMLDGPVGQIGSLNVRVISPAAQIEIKLMTPTWNPRLVRRQKDLDDIATIRTMQRDTR